MNSTAPGSLRVGWIGAGRMGAAMASRLARAGEDVTVWNRTRAKAEPLAEVGCAIADTIADLRGHDVVFTMVSTPADLEQVLVGDGGLLADPDQVPGIVVDCSTVSTESSAAMRAACAERGVAFLASPVSGNGKVVRAGGLSLVVSGPEETYERVSHLLDHLGKGATYVGEGDVARLAKICHNLMLGVVTQCLAEITVLAEKGGMPRAAFLEFLNKSVMGSVFTQYKSPAFVNLDFTPTFTPILLRKDFDLGFAAAHDLDVPMPVAAATAAAVQASVSSGRTEEDFAVLLELQAANSGITLKPENVAVDDGLGGVTGVPLPAPGHMSVDYESRVDFERLRSYRIGRAKQALETSDCGAFLLFDFYNIRYTTQTWIGGALGDKMIRYALLARGKDPVLWDFGSAVKHHKLHSKWVPEDNYRAGFLGFRGAVAPSVGLMETAVAEIKSMLVEAGVADLPVGMDIVEPPFLFEMQRQGITVVDAQQLMLDARCIKSQDEIVLLNQAAAMVDGVYQDIVEVLKPGIRENEIVALANKRLYEMGSDQVEAVNAISGERCNPHPHNFTDRLIRPGDQAFFDIIHSFNGYRTCYYRTFAVGSATASQRDAYTQAREWMDRGIDGIKAGVGTDEIAALLPKAEEFGFDSEMEAFGLQFAHGLGLGLHERPIISRLNSMKEPVELEVGMVFALETYCPASDGVSAARIEEEIVITEDGPRVLTLFPAQDLVVANPY